MKVTLMGSKSFFLVEGSTDTYEVDIIGSEVSDYAHVKIEGVDTKYSPKKGDYIYEEILSEIKNRKQKI